MFIPCLQPSTCLFHVYSCLPGYYGSFCELQTTPVQPEEEADGGKNISILFCKQFRVKHVPYPSHLWVILCWCDKVPFDAQNMSYCVLSFLQFLMFLLLFFFSIHFSWFFLFSHPSPGLGGGAIAGIVVAAVVAVLVIGGVVVFFFYMLSRRQPVMMQGRRPMPRGMPRQMPPRLPITYLYNDPRYRYR